MKVLTIIGARPQFIKASALSRIFKGKNTIEEIILHTGQHFDVNMSDIFFSELSLPYPKYNLNINSLSHGEMTGRMLSEIEKVLFIEKPDFIIVYGDTNSTLAGALAAKKMGIKIAHIEAGLRSNNIMMPEEINRIITDRLSDLLFCPTTIAIKNLKLEGFENFNSKIYLSGDVMYDNAIYFGQKISNNLSSLKDLLNSERGYLLCTAHRPDNTDTPSRLNQIIDALNELSTIYDVIMPIHPRTRKIIRESNYPVNFKIIDPVGYFDMLNLISNSRLILTDSGGLQKEAFFLKKYCITLRDQTEWVELLDHGVNVLVGANSRKIVEAVEHYINKDFPSVPFLYGTGNAAEKIYRTILGQDGDHYPNAIISNSN